MITSMADSPPSPPSLFSGRFRLSWGWVVLFGLRNDFSSLFPRCPPPPPPKTVGALPAPSRSPPGRRPPTRRFFGDGENPLPVFPFFLPVGSLLSGPFAESCKPLGIFPLLFSRSVISPGPSFSPSFRRRWTGSPPAGIPSPPFCPYQFGGSF